jgi:hypothetical protein
LDGATAESDVGALVVEIEHADESTDREAMRKLRGRGDPTIVMAPFRPNGEATSTPEQTGWDIVDATLLPDWRSRMLTWIDERLEHASHDTKLLKHQVEEWLERFDSDGSLVATPGGLLALCADFDMHGGGDGMARQAQRWLTESAVRSFADDVPASWLRHALFEAFTGLAEGHLRSLEREFGSQRKGDWAALVPPETNPTGDEPGARLVSGFLLDAGLLRGAERGLLPYPPWVHRALLVDTLHRDFEGNDPKKWGRIAADATRQHIVDEALDQLGDGSFQALVREVATGGRPRSLAEVAAIEASVAAAGRRLEQPDFKLRKSALSHWQQLATMQLELLVGVGPNTKVRHPFTRRNTDEWFATGWSISLRLPAPDGFQPKSHEWELPGWAKTLSLATIPGNFPQGYFDNKPSANMPVHRMSRMAQKVLPLLADDDLPRDVPRFLLSAILLSEGRRRWNLQAHHLEDLQQSWDGSEFVSQMRTVSGSERKEIASVVWDALADTQRTGSGLLGLVLALERGYPNLAHAVLDDLPEQKVRDAVRVRGLLGDVRHPSKVLAILPKPLRRAAIETWSDKADANQPRYAQARALLPMLAEHDVDLVADTIREADRSTALELTPLIWRLAPKVAREESKLALECGYESVDGWFNSAPRSELPYLVALVQGLDERPAWVSGWAYRRVLDGGNVSEGLFELAPR